MQSVKFKTKLFILTFAICNLQFAICKFPVFAGDKVQLIVGESKIIPVDSPKKIAVGESNIADVKIISEKEILLNGKSAGITTLIIWKPDGSQDTTQISVVAAELEKIMVEVNVQVLEIRKNAMTDFGINWSDTMKALSVGEDTIPPLFGVGNFDRLKKVEASLNLLLKNGQAKLLAKPKLLTISGSKASFLAGGEVPFVYQDSQRMNIEWKEYGVKLDILPVADSFGNINVDIRAEVSNIDSANGINIGSTILPGLRTRWAKTSIYVKKGGTIVIAGLIQSEEVKRTEGVPILSEIPLIGELFKYTHSEAIDSELVIFVTPSIVGQNT